MGQSFQDAIKAVNQPAESTPGQSTGKGSPPASQPQIGEPNQNMMPTDGKYGNTIQPWDNAQIQGPSSSKGSGKSGGSSGGKGQNMGPTQLPEQQPQLPMSSFNGTQDYQ